MTGKGKERGKSKFSFVKAWKRLSLVQHCFIPHSEEGLTLPTWILGTPFGEKKEVSVLFEACVCWSDRKPELLSVNSTCKIYQVYYLTEVTLSLLANRALPENFFYGSMCCQRQSVHWLIATADLNIQGSLCNNPFIIYKLPNAKFNNTNGLT